jgi:long-chain acyl-CoA synthetase
MSTETIPAKFLDQARLRPQQVAYAEKRDGQWLKTSWADFVAQVRRAAKALIHGGFQPGHKVTILGSNRPEWTIFDHAAMCAGGTPAGIYTTSSSTEVRYIVDHSEAEFVLVENASQWEKIRVERENLPRLKHVIFMRGEVPEDPLVLSWEAFLALGDSVEDRVLDERVGAIKEEDPATFIYTSGTTGPPKAVMLSHKNIAWTAITAGNALVTSEDRFLSYLPLSHIAEQMFTIHVASVTGYAVYYAESIEKLRDNLLEVRPTVLFGVPRVWEKFYEAMKPRLAQTTGVRKQLVAWARDVATEASACRMAGHTMPLMLSLQYAAAKRLVFSKLHAALGLDQTRLFVSGAAPITREVLEFFASIDVVIQEVYGQSEDSGPTSFNLTGAVRFGTVGQPFPGVAVRIAEDGEILVLGPNVFLGYYKDPVATAESFADGWLRTGDLGMIDANGFLHITGRKKEIIITAGGKNITPNNLEEAIKTIPLVAEAVVIGDQRRFLAALLTLKPEEAERLAQEHGADCSTPLHTNPSILAALQTGMDRVNSQFARVEQIRKFRVLPVTFSIDGGELTPTMKLKRKVIATKYAKEIEALYAADETRERASG